MAAAIWPPLRALLSHSAGLRGRSISYQRRLSVMGKPRLWAASAGCGYPNVALFCPEVVVNCRRGRFVMRFDWIFAEDFSQSSNSSNLSEFSGPLPVSFEKQCPWLFQALATSMYLLMTMTKAAPYESHRRI